MNGFSVAMLVLVTDCLFSSSFNSREKQDLCTMLMTRFSASSISFVHNSPPYVFLGRNRKHKATIRNNLAYDEYFCSMLHSLLSVAKTTFRRSSGISSNSIMPLGHSDVFSFNHDGPENHVRLFKKSFGN